MRSINKVILVGNLTRDPEMRKTATEQYVTTLGLATNREWVTKDARREQSAEFHELVCWGRLAEIASTKLKKGKLIYVEGYLKTRSWDDQSGTKKFRTEIVIEDLIILEKRPKEMVLSPDEAGDINQETQSQTRSQSHDPFSGTAESHQPTISIEDPFTI